MYRCYLEPFFGRMRLDEITASAVTDFQIEMRRHGVSAVRYSKVIVPLRACLRWHFRTGAFPYDTSFWFDRAAPPADERKVLSLRRWSICWKSSPSSTDRSSPAPPTLAFDLVKSGLSGGKTSTWPAE